MRSIGITGVVSQIALLAVEESTQSNVYYANEKEVLLGLIQRFDCEREEQAQKAIDFAVEQSVIKRENGKLIFIHEVKESRHD